MTRQEIFDHVKAHLLKQGKKAFLPGSKTKCAYRSPDGKKCAGGCLIPDELYHPAMETKIFRNVCFNFGRVKAHIGADNIGFVQELQDIHDCHEPEEWPYRLDDLAELYELNP